MTTSSSQIREPILRRIIHSLYQAISVEYVQVGVLNSVKRSSEFQRTLIGLAFKELAERLRMFKA
jgi:hypothetical protein